MRNSTLYAMALGLLLGSAAVLRAAEPEEISSEFVVPSEQVRTLHESSGLSYDELRTCYILSKETGVSVAQIASERSSGSSFEQIASAHNTDMSRAFNDYSEQRAAAASAVPPIREAPRSTDKDTRRAQKLANRYGYSVAQVMEAHRLETDWWSLEQSLDIARRANIDPSEVIESRHKGLTFAAIEAKYGIDPELQRKPVWDTPSNPFVRNQWYNLGSWNFSQNRYPGFPYEQINERIEKPTP